MRAKSDAGRHECSLCPESTKGHAIILMYDLDRPLGKQVIRAHAKCVTPSNLHFLKGGYDATPTVHLRTLQDEVWLHAVCDGAGK